MQFDSGTTLRQLLNLACSQVKMPIVSVIGSHFITDTHVNCTHSCRAILPHMVLHSCSRKAEMPSMCKGYWPDTLKMPGENNEHQACLVGEDRCRYRARGSFLHLPRHFFRPRVTLNGQLTQLTGDLMLLRALLMFTTHRSMILCAPCSRYCSICEFSCFCGICI